MQFKINKILSGGRYYVDVKLMEFSEDDLQKVKKFGYPTLEIKNPNGTMVPKKIESLERMEPFGFYAQKEADEYNDHLKQQIRALQQYWNKLYDTWSKEEIL